MKKFGKLISWLLAAAMVMTVLPVSVLADTTATVGGVEITLHDDLKAELTGKGWDVPNITWSIATVGDSDDYSFYIADGMDGRVLTLDLNSPLTDQDYTFSVTTLGNQNAELKFYTTEWGSLATIWTDATAVGGGLEKEDLGNGWTKNTRTLSVAGHRDGASQLLLKLSGPLCIDNISVKDPSGNELVKNAGFDLGPKVGGAEMFAESYDLPVGWAINTKGEQGASTIKTTKLITRSGENALFVYTTLGDDAAQTAIELENTAMINVPAHNKIKYSFWAKGTIGKARLEKRDNGTYIDGCGVSKGTTVDGWTKYTVEYGPLENGKYLDAGTFTLIFYGSCNAVIDDLSVCVNDEDKEYYVNGSLDLTELPSEPSEPEPEPEPEDAIGGAAMMAEDYPMVWGWETSTVGTVGEDDCIKLTKLQKRSGEYAMFVKTSLPGEYDDQNNTGNAYVLKNLNIDPANDQLIISFWAKGDIGKVRLTKRAEDGSYINRDGISDKPKETDENGWSRYEYTWGRVLDSKLAAGTFELAFFGNTCAVIDDLTLTLNGNTGKNYFSNPTFDEEEPLPEVDYEIGCDEMVAEEIPMVADWAVTNEDGYTAGSYIKPTELVSKDDTALYVNTMSSATDRYSLALSNPTMGIAPAHKKMTIKFKYKGTLGKIRLVKDLIVGKTDEGELSNKSTLGTDEEGWKYFEDSYEVKDLVKAAWWKIIFYGGTNAVIDDIELYLNGDMTNNWFSNSDFERPAVETPAMDVEAMLLENVKMNKVWKVSHLNDAGGTLKLTETIARNGETALFLVCDDPNGDDNHSIELRNDPAEVALGNYQMTVSFWALGNPGTVRILKVDADGNTLTADKVTDGTSNIKASVNGWTNYVYSYDVTNSENFPNGVGEGYWKLLFYKESCAVIDDIALYQDGDMTTNYFYNEGFDKDYSEEGLSNAKVKRMRLESAASVDGWTFGTQNNPEVSYKLQPTSIVSRTGNTALFIDTAFGMENSYDANSPGITIESGVIPAHTKIDMGFWAKGDIGSVRVAKTPTDGTAGTGESFTKTGISVGGWDYYRMSHDLTGNVNFENSTCNEGTVKLMITNKATVVIDDISVYINGDYSTNYFVNGSFDNNAIAANRDGMMAENFDAVDGWTVTPVNAADTSVMKPTKALARSGKSAMYLNTTYAYDNSFNSNGLVLKNVVTAPKNDQMTISFWAMGDIGRIRLIKYDASGAAVSGDGIAYESKVKTENGWDYYEYSYDLSGIKEIDAGTFDIIFFGNAEAVIDDMAIYLNGDYSTNYLENGGFEYNCPDYEIVAPTFKKGDEEITDGKLVAGDIVVTAGVKNNAMGSEFCPVIIYALYNQGKLSQLFTSNNTIDETGIANTVSTTITVPDLATGEYELKVMIWDGYKTMAPMANFTALSEPAPASAE